MLNTANTAKQLHRNVLDDLVCAVCNKVVVSSRETCSAVVGVKNPEATRTSWFSFSLVFSFSPPSQTTLFDTSASFQMIHSTIHP